MNAITFQGVGDVRGLTGGGGPDVGFLRCGGYETPLAQAIQSVRLGGTVSSVGVYVENALAFPAQAALSKDCTLKVGLLKPGS